MFFEASKTICFGAFILVVRFMVVIGLNFSLRNLVSSTKEKSPQEARQRLAYWSGVTCEDFSFVEMTNYLNLGSKLNLEKPYQSPQT